MRRCTLALTFLLLALGLGAPAARADFGLSEFDLRFTEEDGSSATSAGSHPFAVTNSLALNLKDPYTPDTEIKDIHIANPPGLVGDPNAVPPCSTANFLERPGGPTGETEIETNCPDSTALGVTIAYVEGFHFSGAVYNLQPPPGAVAKIGFKAFSVPVTIDFVLSSEPPYEVIARVNNISDQLPFRGSKLTLWGNPASSVHDPIRGKCAAIALAGDEVTSRGICPTNAPERPFLTLPRSCQGSALTSYAADSWLQPGPYLPSGEPDTADPHWVTGSSQGPGFDDCAGLRFKPSITAKPTTVAASSPTGLDFSLDLTDEGISSPGGHANSEARRVAVTLPPGFSVNPSIAEGLEVCTEADLDRETAFSDPGVGCPQASKIGTVEAESPLLEESVKGAIYQATPYQNPFGSLVALYMVFQNPTLGVLIKQPLRVEPDPATGQLTTVAEDLPQLPVSHFRLHFREGVRSPLVTPSACGQYQVQAELTPWSGAQPVTSTSSLQIITGPDAGPCPTGGLPPFHPSLSAGTVSNAAGRFSPFNVKLTRTDSEQEFTHFSIKLPPGLLGKLAGIPFCSDAQIAQATSRTGPHGGQEELNDPSCPAASQVGRTLAGAGAGAALAYAPGKVYLAGPYHGHPVSLVAITAGVVGPFDIGTVLVRLALDVNPETGEVFLDSTGSDPIPHIVQGIPVHLRDIRAYTDRPDFVFNPTSCEPSSTSATVLGSGLDFVSTLDDNPFVSTSRFQAADCAALPFKPKLTVQLKGSTKRAGNPALHAHLTMAGMGASGANEAGLAYSRVALPKSLFLDNAHINTICTRVQFREGAVEGEKCPPGSVIGTAKAVTPILSEPLTGPIYLRSSEHQLPDIAAALHGSEISVVAVGHTDSAPGGGLRNTFDVVPDAPITSVDIDLFGGKKGLIISSRNLCSYKPKAKVEFKGHNGKHADYPKLQIKATGCKKKGKKRSKRHAHR